MRHARVASVIAVTACAVAVAIAQAADLKSPDKVKDALQLLAYVQADMASKLPNKAYSRLPHENEEFQEAAPALRDAIAGEPAAFKARIEALLGKAQAAANDVGALSKTNDEAKISASVTAVLAALKPLNEAFPEGLRPVLGKLGPRPGRPAGGPPPDLR